jgi:hypothetical protein
MEQSSSLKLSTCSGVQEILHNVSLSYLKEPAMDSYPEPY